MGSANCTNPPAETPSNSGVAGIGVILGFIVPAVIAIVLSLSLIVQESFLHSNKPALGLIRRKLLYGLSDQQILYGIGIQAVGLAQMSALVPYHSFIIWMLSLLSMAIHNCTLLVLAASIRPDTVLRWLRQALMLTSLVLSCVYGVCMLQVVQKGLEASTLPTSCAWEVEGGRAGNVGLSFVGTIAVIAGNCVVFTASTWYLHDRRQRGFRWVQLVGWVVMTAIAVAATVRVVLMSQAFGEPTTPLSDRGEKQWTFATMVSLLMLALPLMTVLEIYRGEVHVNGSDSFEKMG
ncbi:hypothetical protein VPNG_08336 [Cytospora leucostoma]|uniref:Uncharacterized protein n=1 Tax=Cytospora leucostoma TaxID=1230097 RepID=A0A423W9H6_9PEZI|nr:hypothetical protein VPNG_08336 [Cytospora leucostoma]